MAKIGVSVCIDHPVRGVDPKRMATVLVNLSHLTQRMAEECVRMVTDTKETTKATMIGMPSLDDADDLRDALIDLGVHARTIDHDATTN